MVSFSRRVFLAASTSVAVGAAGASFAHAGVQIVPLFGSRSAATDAAHLAASEKCGQWKIGCGMARAYHIMARHRALHIRLLAYIDHHIGAFGGSPTAAHVVAVTQLMSQRTVFARLWSCFEAFDACSCPRCFPALWRAARTSEIEQPGDLALAIRRVRARRRMVQHAPPPAHAGQAWCKFEAPVQPPAGVTARYWTLAFAAPPERDWKSLWESASASPAANGRASC